MGSVGPVPISRTRPFSTSSLRSRWSVLLFIFSSSSHSATVGEADGFVLWDVIDVVLAGEFELTIIVAPIESHAFFWKRLDKMIRGTTDGHRLIELRSSSPAGRLLITAL